MPRVKKLASAKLGKGNKTVYRKPMKGFQGIPKGYKSRKKRYGY